MTAAKLEKDRKVAKAKEYGPDANQLELFEIEAIEKVSKETFLEASNVVNIREQPHRPFRPFRLERAAIGQAKGEYMLIGFDTEYQTLQESFTNAEVKGGAGRYEVLSYQFFALGCDETTCSGIAVPNPDQRLTFAQFLIYALASVAERGQTIPSKIVLVGHYNRADIPTFDDRGKIYDQVRNVRNSLITQVVPITVKVSFADDNGEPVDLKIYLRDTMLLAPAGKRSLAALGELVGKAKMKLHDDPDKELLIKKRMKILRDNDWPKFKEYAMLDAEVCVLYFQQVTRLYQNVTGAKFVPSVLSNIGVTLLKQEWAARDPKVAAITMVGQEAHSEVIWNDKTAQFNTRRFTPYIEEIHWHISLATECYHGGRSEQLWFGPSFEDQWGDYDLTSAYPTAMAVIGMPDWAAAFPTRDLNELTLDVFGFACVDFRFPEGTRYPTLPVRTANGIIFPLSGRSYCATPELRVAIDIGCEIRVRNGVVIPTDSSNKVFAPFIKASIRRRHEAESDIEKAFWKELTNSCYGKTAQGLCEKRVFGLRTKKSEKLGPSAITNPFYAAYITSFVRAAVGEIMNGLPKDKMVFSVTTDGFITNATTEEVDAAKNGPVMNVYRQTVLELTGKDAAVAQKHAVKQLLGWRTRGQATLRPGDAGDDTRFVLAKGGVQPPKEYTTVEEQNGYMLQLFFKRTPATVIDIEVHTTMADMIKHGADLVSKKSRKKASMEYDFKRCPLAIGLATSTLRDGSQHDHIVFSTKPWRDVNEFKIVREMWENYRRSEKVCLKSIDDYAHFAEWFEMMKSLPDGSKKYLRRKDKTGLQRLRRDITRAFKNGKAGFPQVRQLSAQQFADILNSTSMPQHGVTTDVSDVENGKRAAFAPNSTPPTKEVLKVLRELKVHFPAIDTTSIVGRLSPDQMVLSGALRTGCIFVERIGAAWEAP